MTKKAVEDIGTFALMAKVEIALIGPDVVGLSEENNPFAIQADVTFTGPGGQMFVMPAFYDGDGQGGLDGNLWKVRFSPDAPGEWKFISSSAVSKLNAHEGSFEVLPNTACQTGVGDPANLTCLGSLQSAEDYYLKFSNGDYWIKGGIDDPENFIGEAFGDWDAKRSAIDYLSTKEVNSIYVITNNIDGDRNDTWPWVGSTPEQAKANSDRFDTAKLQEWEDFFTYVENKGIVLHIVLDDDSAWHDYDHDLYYQEMVARFGHHPGIIWNIGEEANENYSNNEQISLAARMQTLDPYNHLVTVHRVPLWPFLGNSNFDTTSIQAQGGAGDFSTTVLNDFNETVITHRERGAAAGRPIPVMIDELPRVTAVNPGTQYKMRSQVLYPIYFGGGNYEMHFFDVYGGQGKVSLQDLSPMLDDMRRARQFLETLPFWTMEPCNELLSARGSFCFGKPGQAYVFYFPSGGSYNVDLSALKGSLSVAWYNPRSGKTQDAGSVSGGGWRSFDTPDDQDWVLRLGGGSLNPCFASSGLNQSVSSDHEVTLDLSMFAFRVFLPMTMHCSN